MTSKSSDAPLEKAVKLYALMGKKLYRETLTKNERRALVAARHELVQQYGPLIRANDASPTGASKKYLTVRKPVQAKYVLLVLGPKREVLRKMEFRTVELLRSAVSALL